MIKCESGFIINLSVIRIVTKAQQYLTYSDTKMGFDLVISCFIL